MRARFKVRDDNGDKTQLMTVKVRNSWMWGRMIENNNEFRKSSTGAKEEKVQKNQN